jgi:hypothetical protein
VQGLLGSRVVLGEIHFGSLTPNLSAHPAIVDRDLWTAVQKIKVPRGRKPKSDQLLARIGVLRCGSCGARMCIGYSKGHRPFFRCPATNDCERRQSILSETADSVVIAATRQALADVTGRASAEASIRQAQRDLEDAQGTLDAAIRAFDGFEDEQAARDRLAELREARDVAQVRCDQLGSGSAALTVNGAKDWDALSLDGQRELIRAVIASATVGPGRGADRITVRLLAE